MLQSPGLKRVMTGVTENPNLTDNWDDAEGYYRGYPFTTLFSLSLCLCVCVCMCVCLCVCVCVCVNLHSYNEYLCVFTSILFPDIHKFNIHKIMDSLFKCQMISNI